MTEQLGKIHEAEDPLEGDVDRVVHPDETRTDEQIAHDERRAIEPWEDDGSSAAELESGESTNEFSRLLTDAIREKALAHGATEQDVQQVCRASLIIKDGAGNATDRMDVTVNTEDSVFGVSGAATFYLAPINGDKNEYGSDLKYVYGHFVKHPGGDTILDAMNMSYRGGTPEALGDYASAALQEGSLLRAELVAAEVYDRDQSDYRKVW